MTLTGRTGYGVIGRSWTDWAFFSNSPKTWPNPDRAAGRCRSVASVADALAIGRAKPLKVHRDALALPVAIARGFRAFGSARFRRQLLFIFLGAARFGFGSGALAGFGNAGGNYVFAGGRLIGHETILHSESLGEKR